MYRGRLEEGVARKETRGRRLEEGMARKKIVGRKEEGARERGIGARVVIGRKT